MTTNNAATTLATSENLFQVENIIRRVRSGALQLSADEQDAILQLAADVKTNSMVREATQQEVTNASTALLLAHATNEVSLMTDTLDRLRRALERHGIPIANLVYTLLRTRDRDPNAPPCKQLIATITQEPDAGLPT